MELRFISLINYRQFRNRSIDPIFFLFLDPLFLSMLMEESFRLWSQVISPHSFFCSKTSNTRNLSKPVHLCLRKRSSRTNWVFGLAVGPSFPQGKKYWVKRQNSTQEVIQVVRTVVSSSYVPDVNFNFGQDIKKVERQNEFLLSHLPRSEYGNSNVYIVMTLFTIPVSMSPIVSFSDDNVVELPFRPQRSIVTHTKRKVKKQTSKKMEVYHQI